MFIYASVYYFNFILITVILCSAFELPFQINLSWVGLDKRTFFINNRGLKPDQGADPPYPLTLTTNKDHGIDNTSVSV